MAEQEVVYIAMLSYNLTEWDYFDENLIGVYSQKTHAMIACGNVNGNGALDFFYNPARQGFWVAQSDTYNPLRTTWFYVFKRPIKFST